MSMNRIMIIMTNIANSDKSSYEWDNIGYG